MLSDLLAHQYAEKGAPSEEYEDDEFDVNALMEAAAAGDDWEDVIRE